MRPITAAACVLLLAGCGGQEQADFSDFTIEGRLREVETYQKLYRDYRWDMENRVAKLEERVKVLEADYEATFEEPSACRCEICNCCPACPGAKK